MGGNNFPQRIWFLGGLSLGVSLPGSPRKMSPVGIFLCGSVSSWGRQGALRGSATSQRPSALGMIFRVRGEFLIEEDLRWRLSTRGNVSP